MIIGGLNTIYNSLLFNQSVLSLISIIALYEFIFMPVLYMIIYVYFTSIQISISS